MKRLLFAVVLAVFATATVSAQDNYYKTREYKDRFRTKYRNFSYGVQTTFERGMIPDETVAESKFAAAFTTGRSYIMHRRPIARILHIGLDATWFELNYAQGKSSYGGETIHQADIAMGVGPSVHVTPIAKLGVHTYVRYNPTFSAMFEEGMEVGDIRIGYASMFVAGGAVSWSAISLGAEARWGGGNYSPVSGDGGKRKLQTVGYRVYVGLRF